jgi:hypothetical protein
MTVCRRLRGGIRPGLRARDHPDDFSLGGDVLDMLRVRAAYRRGLWP